VRNIILFVVEFLILCTPAPAQEQPRQLKGGGHLLGESAEQFFSEGYVGDVLRACQAQDWKTVNHLTRSADRSSKKKAKDICAIETLARQQATSGARLEYRGRGDEAAMRTDRFTFDGGHLVKIDTVYAAPMAAIEGYDPKPFGDLFAELQKAYGEPTKTYAEPVLNPYGVKFDAHRAIWMGKENVIIIIEQPGASGWTEIAAETVAEYNRPAPASNPLR
jgi:hypothetical protein